MSSMVPCAPSNMTVLPSRMALLSSTEVSQTMGRMRGFVLEHVRHDPDESEIHDGVQVRIGHNFHLRESLAIRDIPSHRRVHGDVLDRLSSFEDLVDLRFAEIPQFQTP